MNNVHVEADYDLKALGLSVLQLIGAFTAFLIHLISRWWFYKVEEPMYWALLIGLAGLVCVSAAVIIERPSTKNGVRLLLGALVGQEIPGRDRKQTSRDDLLRILRIFAWSDLAVAGFCMMNTGDSEKSVFSPFLFIVVPMVVIINVMSWKEIAVLAVASFTIYEIALFEEVYRFICPYALHYISQGHIKHNLVLSFTTIVCSSFPIFFTIMEQKHKKRESVASTSQTQSEGTQTYP